MNFWELQPGAAREALKRNQERKHPSTIRGPAKIHTDRERSVIVGHWVCGFDPGNPASIAWSRAAVLAPQDPLSLTVLPKFVDGVLHVSFRGRDFHVGNSPSPRNVNSLYEHIRRVTQ